MNSPSAHQRGIRTLERRIAWVLMFRGGLIWSGSWFLIWGVVVLIGRFTSSIRYDWLALGLLGFLPMALCGALLQLRQRPEFAVIRARFDGLNRCGGFHVAFHGLLLE